MWSWAGHAKTQRGGLRLRIPQGSESRCPISPGFLRGSNHNNPHFRNSGLIAAFCAGAQLRGRSRCGFFSALLRACMSRGYDVHEQKVALGALGQLGGSPAPSLQPEWCFSPEAAIPHSYLSSPSGVFAVDSDRAFNPRCGRQALALPSTLLREPNVPAQQPPRIYAHNASSRTPPPSRRR